jgi:sporulation protein YlmC with PRC-barrel domain
MNTSSTTHGAELVKLSDTGLVLADRAQDLRGFTVRDSHHEEIGHVSGLFIDREQRKVRMLEIRAGGFLGIGDRHFLLPCDSITSIDDKTVTVDASRERIVGSPVYDPDLVVEPSDQTWEPYYGYYGLAPYWSPGYMYPTFPTSRSEARLRTQPPHTHDL